VSASGVKSSAVGSGTPSSTSASIGQDERARSEGELQVGARRIGEGDAGVPVIEATNVPENGQDNARNR
jgi:hypothetical protein